MATQITGVPSGKLDESKAELIAHAVKVGERGHGGEADARFLRRYYQHVAPEDIVGRDPVDVAGAALSNRELALRRPQGTANVRVFTPAIEEHGNPGIHVRFADGVSLQRCRVAWGPNRPDYYTHALQAHDETGLTYPGFQGESAHPERFAAVKVT